MRRARLSCGGPAGDSASSHSVSAVDADDAVVALVVLLLGEFRMDSSSSSSLPMLLFALPEALLQLRTQRLVLRSDARGEFIFPMPSSFFLTFLTVTPTVFK